MKSDDERVKNGMALQRQLSLILLRANRVDQMPAQDAILVLFNLQRELLKKMPAAERDGWVNEVFVPLLQGHKVEPERKVKLINLVN